MYCLGKKVVMHLFGKSHGTFVGCILEGIPAGIAVSEEIVQRDMDLRKPKDRIGTPRKESDHVNIASGVINGVTDGSPITIMIRNNNTDGSKYLEFEKRPRPGHADFPALNKFKTFDIRGGGQFSGRMTAPIVAAGSIAKQYLDTRNIRIAGFTRSIGSICDTDDRNIDDAFGSRRYDTRACTDEIDRKMKQTILDVSAEGDSIGGVVECISLGMSPGFGGIWFEALDSEIARAVFSIPGVKGVEFGKGFDITGMKGSQSNDAYIVDDGVKTRTNNMGGILGGMSDGMPMVFRTAFKPTPSIAKTQDTVNLETGKNDTISIRGRHDPCIVPRAVSVVEAMTALVIADQMRR
ncbi:MAG: chorismate synthase [Candidatus Methanomethylophilaceae archaeon]